MEFSNVNRFVSLFHNFETKEIFALRHTTFIILPSNHESGSLQWLWFGADLFSAAACPKHGPAVGGSYCGGGTVRAAAW